MKVAVIGSGGREHAVIKKIKDNKKIEKLYAIPGNGGIAADAECVAIGAKEIERIVEFSVEKKIDFVVVTPDDPLVLGLVDRLHEVGIACFGPSKAAAAIEGSKAFAKELMAKYNIPTASYKTFTDMGEALTYLEEQKMPVVIKADGLALGKGVIIAEDLYQAQNAVKSMMSERIFGDSGNCVVIEEFLVGPEVSVLAFTDGKTVVPMVSSMDHKRAKDGDEGLNTGGMGTVAPNPYYTDAVAQRCMNEIFLPTVNAMNAEGRTFKGCLYFGLMVTADGPKVIEYNCRFGDPETQVVLPLLKSDLFDIMLAVEEGKLSEVNVEFENKCACCVILASDGYPQKYQSGYEISVGNVKGDIFVAGAKLENGKLLTSGGRVIGVTDVADTLENAVKAAYADIEEISFKNKYCRHDIGAKALDALK